MLFPLLCPYCSELILVESQDHIFPQFLGGSRTITTCKDCNDRFGRTFEGKAAPLFQRLHFHLAANGVNLQVEQVRLRRVFKSDGSWYDAEICDGQPRFTLSDPIVEIDQDRKVLNAKFGSLKQMPSVRTGIRKKYGVELPKPEIEVTSALMPAQEFGLGPETMKLAIKMSAALATLIPDFAPTWMDLKGSQQASLDFWTALPLTDVPPLAHVVYAERSATGIQGVVKFFGAQQVFCSVSAQSDIILPFVHPKIGVLAFLDPVTGRESFRQIQRVGLPHPPNAVSVEDIARGMKIWGDQFRDAAISRGAAETFEFSLKQG